VSGFNEAAAATLNIEGGFQNDPADDGNWTGGKRGLGELKGTNCGISAKSYPTEDIRNMTPARARYLFKRDYWDRIRGDDLPYSLALVTFDAGINCGIETAAQWLQHALGVQVDGVVGPQTITAAQFSRDKKLTAAGICRRRIIYSASLHNWPRYATTWVQRTFDVYRMAVEAA
jgi:lysozyme family protein